MTLEEEKRLKKLRVVIYSQLLVEAMGEAKGTDIYIGKAKQHANILVNVLTPMLKKQMLNVHQTNPRLTNNLFNKVDDLVTEIAKENILDIVMIYEIYKHYKKYPDDYNSVFGIEMERLND